jgi:transcriptional regulator with XRE-family HTH domain
MAKKNKRFGELLGRLIDKSKLSKRKIAKLADVSPSAIGAYVNTGRVPEAPILVKLADLFGMTVKDLLSGKEPGGKSVPPKNTSIREFSAIYTEGLPKRERECVEALIAILLKGLPEDKKTVQTLINHVYKNSSVKKIRKKSS